MKTRPVIWLIGFCLWCASAGVATAQPEGPRAMANRAVKLAQDDNHGEAVEIFHQVIDALPAAARPKVHRLLGYSYMKLEMLAEAWHHLTRYLEASGTEDTMAGAWLEEVEAALKQSHVKVSFSCHPTATTIKLPSSAPGTSASPPTLHKPMACPATWWLAPGKHKVAAGAPEHKARMVEVDVRARGDSGVREIRLEAITPALTKGEGESHAEGTTVVKPAAPKKPTRVLEWTLLGSGLALGATGAIFQGLGYSKNESLRSKDKANADFPYEERYQDQVRPMEIASYVLYGVGGAAVVAGVVTWFVRKPGGKDAKSSVFSVSPLPLPGGSGALMTWEF